MCGRALRHESATDESEDRLKTKKTDLICCPVCGKQPKSKWVSNQVWHGHKISCEGIGHEVGVSISPHDDCMKPIWKKLGHDIWKGNTGPMVMAEVKAEAIKQWNAKKF